LVQISGWTSAIVDEDFRGFPQTPEKLLYNTSARSRGRSSSPSRVKNFLFPKSSRPTLRSTQPPAQWVPGVLSPGVKRPGREVDHTPPTSAEVKKNVDLHIHSHIRLHVVVLN
jgi:hypothetical protein